MWHGDALRQPGGTRGEQRVRRRLGTQHTAALGVGERPVRVCAQVESVDLQQLAIDGQRGRVGGRGQNQPRIGGVDHMRVALGWVGRVERDVGAARRQDRVHADHQVTGPAHRQTDLVARSHARREEFPREAVHLCRELRVGQDLIARHQGDGVRSPGGLLLEPLDERRARRCLRSSGPRFEQLVLARPQQVHVADRPVRCRDQRVEGADESLRVPGGGVLVEEIGRVDERHVVAGGALGHGDLEVELGDGGLDALGLHGQARKVHCRGLEVLQGELHLVQRGVRGGSGRVEDLHEPFERHVGVLEGLQIGVLDLR
ncbi:hypothetical protein GCM10009855_08330 [Gordonia cholesterolivorans]|uniref:Uncharacterized protein n=1 Tax=Gordonia cholesterolivorans TaxID=559625 RepID=A0ABP5U812_9ACTN